jgi:hypothetical protein
VWDCLPGSAKLARVSVSAFFVAAPLIALAARRAPVDAALGSSGARVEQVLFAAPYGLLGLVAAVVLGFALVWRRRGLAADEIAGMLFGPTLRPSFWSRPEIAAHLSPRLVGAACIPSQPETAHDYLRSISEAAESLTGPARALGSEAIKAARQLLASIQVLDAEIVTLARDADPVEVARIEQKLAAVSAAEADSDEQQMRTLLKGQLELVRRLGARLEAAAEHRAQLVGMLKTLWLQIANLRAQTAEESLEGRELTERIHGLCAAIDVHVERQAHLPADAPLPDSESPGESPPREGPQPASVFD